MIGPPGSGKTTLTRRVPSFLSPLTHEEALVTTKIHPVAGVLPSHEAQDRSAPSAPPLIRFIRGMEEFTAVIGNMPPLLDIGVVLQVLLEEVVPTLSLDGSAVGTADLVTLTRLRQEGVAGYESLPSIQKAAGKNMDGSGGTGDLLTILARFLAQR